MSIRFNRRRFKGEILVQLGKSVLPGRTKELNRCINCCKRELTKLAKWIKIKDIQNANELSVAPRTIESILTQLLTHQVLGKAWEAVKPTGGILHERLEERQGGKAGDEKNSPAAPNADFIVEDKGENYEFHALGEVCSLKKSVGVERLLKVITSPDRKVAIIELYRIGAELGQIVGMLFRLQIMLRVSLHQMLHQLPANGVILSHFLSLWAFCAMTRFRRPANLKSHQKPIKKPYSLLKRIRLHRGG